MGLTRLNGVVLFKMLKKGLEILEENRAVVDVLNVFPVPDGDTGTNMVLTMKSAAKAMEECGSKELQDLATAISMGSMMGARGNSGVILSQLLRGFTKALEGKNEVSVQEFADALQKGVNTAYKVVMKPVEGTILTVSREAARGAIEAAKKSTNISEVLDAAIIRGNQALKHTPELLPVLKRAGVVDAGGKGYMLILQGAREGLRRLEEDETPYELPKIKKELPLIEDDFTTRQEADKATLNLDSEFEFQYCTEVILKGLQLSLDDLRKELSNLGDSLIVMGTDQIGKVHIHSNHPGLVLEKCLKFGSLNQVKIDNMLEQHRELEKIEKSHEAAENIKNIQEVSQEITAFEEGRNIEENPPALSLTISEMEADSKEAMENYISASNPKPNPKGIELVAISMGPGLTSILRSLGVDQIVEGGQSMNPSTEDLVQAIERTNADQVLILPNNNNIILAAEQATKLVDKEVKVIPTRNFAQAIGAMIAFDPEESIEDNYEKMLEGSKKVKSGEVTFAVRDCQLEGLEIKTNQILGINDGDIKIVGENISQVVKDLLETMVGEDDSLISLFYGADVDVNAAEDLANALKDMFPMCEVELHEGGQPLYYYLISVE